MLKTLVQSLGNELSCALDSRSENVCVKAVIVAELKFGDVQRHVLGADPMERSDDTAFEDAPKAFNGLSVNSTDDVLTFGMVNSRVREFFAEMVIANPLIDRCRAG